MKMPRWLRCSGLLVVALSFPPAVSAEPITGNKGDLPEACLLPPPERGESKALFTIYYYDQDRNACKEAYYGGCGGVVPFQDLDKCRAACETEETLRMHEACQLPKHSAARLIVSYPAKWGHPHLSAHINDQEARYRIVGKRKTPESIVLELIVPLEVDAVRKVTLKAKHDALVFEAFTFVYW